ncbi:protein PAIR1 isoform X4 [Triticum aestivum]|uniref:protein PAIR1 isoform X4 n=1 Tax=Triticum aestivum TaxID=4565 RepID=UPI001D004573|nr:protein PAIR1-like isoform X4 [Triticum aestivum]
MQLPPSGSNFLPGAPLLLAGHRRRLAGEGKGGGADEARDQQRVRPPRRLSPPARLRPAPLRFPPPYPRPLLPLKRAAVRFRTRSGGGRAGAPPASSSAASAAGNPPQAAPSQQQQAFSLPRPKLPRLPESEAFVDQTLHRPTPARHQGFGLHDDSSERMPPFPPSSACGAQEEPQQQQPVIIPSSTTLRWNPSPTDTRCRVNEDAECRFQQLSGSVHKVGMVLDSVQTDVIQLNRTMKDASVESGGVQQKFDLLEDTLQKIIKGQNDLKVLAENSMKSNSDQLNVLNSRTSKLNEMSLVVSVCPKQVQADLRELHGDIFRVLTKDMEGVVRDIRSLNTRPAAMSMLPDQNFSPNERLPRNPMLAKGSPLMNGVSVANRRPTMNQTPAANERPLMNQSPVANGRSTMNQTPVANGRSLMNQTPVKNGSPMTIPVGDGRSQLKQTPVTDGTPQRDLTPEINGRPQKDRIPVANGRPHMEQIPATKPLPARSTYATRASVLKPKVEEGMVKAAHMVGTSYRLAPAQKEKLNQKVNPQETTKKEPVKIIIDDSEHGTRLSVLKPKVEQGKVKAAHMVGTSYRLAPSQKEELNQKVNPQEPTKKEPVNIIIGSDNDNKGCTSGGILNMEAADLRKEVGSESGPQLVWGARKMRTSSETLPIDAATLLPGEGEKRRRGPGRDTQKGEAVHAVEATPAKRAHRFNPKYDATLWITC